AWHIPATMAGDEVLELARDGVPLALSVGFVEVPGGSRWSPDRRRVTRVRAQLDHIAVVRRGAYVGAVVAGVRSADDTRGLPPLQPAQGRPARDARAAEVARMVTARTFAGGRPGAPVTLARCVCPTWTG